MIEDKTTEKLKKRLQDMGLIVNAIADKDKSPRQAGNGTPTSKEESNKGSKK